jgi:hypothetical protein
MRRYFLLTGLLFGACTFIVQKNVERCDFDEIRCADDLLSQVECINGIEIETACGSGLSCVEEQGCSCGDGVADGAEECDGNDLPAEDCADLADENFDQGVVQCNADCTLNLDDCSLCGNGRVEANEECDADVFGCDDACALEESNCNNSGNAALAEICDGDDLRGQSCVSLGFDSGTLVCVFDGDDCGFNVDGCVIESD